MVGLTVVAFGTSAPDLAVSVQSAGAGQADLALGNVVGSNIFNVLLILGLSALVAPLIVSLGVRGFSAIVSPAGICTRERGAPLLRAGGGEQALVFLHGGWASHAGWNALSARLSGAFTTVVFDRRGHSRSERPDRQGSIREDVGDVAGLIEHLDIAPAWVIGLSGGETSPPTSGR